MAVIAWRLPADQRHAVRPLSLRPGRSRGVAHPCRRGDPVPVFVQLRRDHELRRGLCRATGGDAERRCTSRTFCVTILATRPFLGRYADRVGPCARIVPCLVADRAWRSRCWPWATTRAGFIVSAILFGAGFGSAYPIFVAHLMHHVARHRRGATFGALIGALTPASARARLPSAG